MSDVSGTATGRDGVGLIDSTVPHAARVYDYMLGGVTNFEVDRAAAEQAAALVGGMDRIGPGAGQPGLPRPDGALPDP